MATLKGMMKAGRRRIANFQSADIRDIEQDFGFTRGQTAASYKNLLTTGRGLAANMTVQQARDMAAVQRLSAAARRVPGKVNRAEAASIRRYGTAMGSNIEEQYNVADAAGAATVQTAEGFARAAKETAKGGRTAMGIMGQTAVAAKAGASYANSVALKSRYQVSAAQVAEMQFELQKMKMDNRYAMQAMQRQYDLQLRNDKAMLEAQSEALDPEKNANLVRLQDMGVQSFTSLQTIFNTKTVDSNGDGTPDAYPNAQQAADAYAASLGFGPGTDQYMVIQHLATAMYGAGAGPTHTSPNDLGAGGLYGKGASPGERQQLVFESVKDTLMALYPDMAEDIDANFERMRAQVGTVFTREAIKEAAEDPDEGTSLIDKFATYFGIKAGDHGHIPYFLAGPLGPIAYGAGEGGDEGVPGVLSSYWDIAGTQAMLYTGGTAALGIKGALAAGRGGAAAQSIASRIGLGAKAAKPLAGIATPGGLPAAPGSVAATLPSAPAVGPYLPAAPGTAQLAVPARGAPLSSVRVPSSLGQIAPGIELPGWARNLDLTGLAARARAAGRGSKEWALLMRLTGQPG